MMQFKMNSRGMRELLRSEPVRKELRKRAERVADRANQNAPVGDTQALSQSHKVVDDTTDRAVARVVTDLEYAITVEANTGYLSRALDAAGGDGA